MKKYEYHQIYTSITQTTTLLNATILDVKELNELGQQGWELVSMQEIARKIIWVFKREMNHET